MHHERDERRREKCDESAVALCEDNRRQASDDRDPAEPGRQVRRAWCVVRGFGRRTTHHAPRTDELREYERNHRCHKQCQCIWIREWSNGTPNGPRGVRGWKTDPGDELEDRPQAEDDGDESEADKQRIWNLEFGIWAGSKFQIPNSKFFLIVLIPLCIH